MSTIIILPKIGKDEPTPPQPSEIGMPEIPITTIEKQLQSIVDSGYFQCGECGFHVYYKIQFCPLCSKVNVFYHV